MAFNTIKGLTVEIGGDTTQLGKALENVNKKSRDLSSELGEINRLLKLDPGNADLLAQKQEVLAEAVQTTTEKLNKLKEAEKQVQAQFKRGEVSEEQVRALKREVEQAAKKLDSYEEAARETAEAVENLGKKSKASADDLNTIASVGFKTVAGAATAAIGSLVAAAESTREYRTAMGKLNTAFEESGFSSATATGAYEELVGILGESDQSVEAANHLAKLTNNEKDLATWTGDILPGVFATFGDSLPIEGLTEAANETAKVGAVTGPLADALNWAGISEEEFNEKLEDCSSEQERQALITKTLADTYGDASKAYKETNKDVINANKANDGLQSSLAGIGAAVEPVITKVKEIGAELLNKLVPVINTILNNLPTVAVVLGGITAALVSYKIAALAATAAEKGMTLAQYAAATAQRVLNTALKANPIGLVIIAITALVAAFTYLWNNCESFRQFWIDLWENIKAAFASVVEWLGNAAASIAEFFSKAWDKVKGVWSAVAGFFSGIWSGIKNAFSAVGSWFKDIFTRAWNGVKNAWGSVKTFFSNIWKKIKSAFNLKEMLNIGKNLVEGLWKGISSAVDWLWDKVSGWVSGLWDGILGFFGIASPSKQMAWVGEMLSEGIAKGLEDSADVPADAMLDVAQGVMDASAMDVGNIGFERQLRTANRTAAVSAAAADNSAMLSKLDGIYNRLGNLQVVLDSGATVGGLIDKIDSGLARRQLLSARGV